MICNAFITKFKNRMFLILSCLLLSSCNDKTSRVDKHNQSTQLKSTVPEVALIKESFTTLRDESDNVDSPALWHGKEGQDWLLATAKEGNAIIVYDAANERKLPVLAVLERVWENLADQTVSR